MAAYPCYALLAANKRRYALAAFLFVLAFQLLPRAAKIVQITTHWAEVSYSRYEVFLKSNVPPGSKIITDDARTPWALEGQNDTLVMHHYTKSMTLEALKQFDYVVVSHDLDYVVGEETPGQTLRDKLFSVPVDGLFCLKASRECGDYGYTVYIYSRCTGPSAGLGECTCG